MPTVRTTIPAITVFDPKPLYALAGAGDLAVERYREVVASFPEQVKVLRKQVDELPTRAQSFPIELRKQVKVLRKQAEDFPSRAQSLPVELRKQAEDFRKQASSAYDDFATRGEKVVAGLRGEKPGKSFGTHDRKPATPAAKKTTAKRTTAKRTTAKKTTAKRPTAKKATARRTPAKKVTASVRTTSASS
jgi:hypothetical protein